MTEHRIERGQVHYKWDNAIKPVLEVAPRGDIVHCETDEVPDGQVKPGSPASALGAIDFNRLYPLAGPILVRGAEPGDTATPCDARACASNLGLSKLTRRALPTRCKPVAAAHVPAGGGS